MLHLVVCLLCLRRSALLAMQVVFAMKRRLYWMMIVVFVCAFASVCLPLCCVFDLFAGDVHCILWQWMRPLVTAAGLAVQNKNAVSRRAFKRCSKKRQFFVLFMTSYVVFVKQKDCFVVLK